VVLLAALGTWAGTLTRSGGAAALAGAAAAAMPPASEADTLTHLGDTHYAAGEIPEASDAWQQALDILHYLHHPDADKICVRLASAQSQSYSSRAGSWPP
jgi:predicted TPR repeat methyltransferase